MQQPGYKTLDKDKFQSREVLTAAPPVPEIQEKTHKQIKLWPSKAPKEEERLINAETTFEAFLFIPTYI